MHRVLVVVIAVGCHSAPVPAPPANQVATPITPTPPAAAAGLAFQVVDNDSSYMQAVFKHVGSGAGGAPTDAVALERGIRVDLDAWRAEAAPYRQVDYYLQGSDRATLQRYVDDLAADPKFRIPADHVVAFGPIGPGQWRSYYLVRAVRLDASAVADAQRTYDPNTSAPIVLLELTPAGGQALATLTTEIVGKKLAILFDGIVKSAPIIEAPITQGRASIAMGGTDPDAQEREADRIVKTLRPH